MKCIRGPVLFAWQRRIHDHSAAGPFRRVFKGTAVFQECRGCGMPCKGLEESEVGCVYLFERTLCITLDLSKPGWAVEIEGDIHIIPVEVPGFVAGAWAGETDAVAPRTVPDRVHFCSGGTGGSAGGPSSRTRGHSADRSSIPHMGCVSGLCDGDLSGVLGDSWRSSAVHGGRGRASRHAYRARAMP
jgi:hypothetical protein